jgi:hypothetical protein
VTTRLAIAISFALLVACVGGGSSRRGGLPEDMVKTFPPDVEQSYRLFAVRCSRCHTLSRPLNASISEYSHWEQYVARMRRHSGSGISPQDAEEILVFLKYYTEHKLQLAATSTEAKP